MKKPSPLAPSTAAALLLCVSCGSDTVLENHNVSNANPAPTIVAPESPTSLEGVTSVAELDLAAPSKFETATFALG